LITQPTQSVDRIAVALRGAFCQAAYMSRPSLLIQSAFALAIASSAACAGELHTYRLDPTHTQIVFFVDHLGLSKGIGRLKIDQGWFQFDPDDWTRSRVDLTILPGSLDMGDAKWTDAVLAARFFDAQRWPRARFSSDSVRRIEGNDGVIEGYLDWRGVKQPVQLRIRFNQIRKDPYSFKTKAGFSASASMSRFDFGMQRYRDVIGEQIELRIEVEGIRDARAAKEQ
jgi:polyisoprenoid-binding protein YceI